MHQKIDGIVAADPAVFAGLPPTVRKILLFENGAATVPADLGGADVVIVPGPKDGRAELEAAHPDVRFGRYVEIVDADTLEDACLAARLEAWSVLDFRDPTKIPLEIVIAAASGAPGSIVTTAADTEEAEILYGVLEHGSDGVLMRGRTVGDATALRTAATAHGGEISLVELEVTATTHIGMGERACVDTTTHFRKDEGILVGSHSKGMVLCVSETHPLPYMPTRPFRVNAGALHSYTVGQNGRTHYLSELHAGEFRPGGRRRRPYPARQRRPGEDRDASAHLHRRGRAQRADGQPDPPGRLARAGPRPRRLGAQQHRTQAGRPHPGSSADGRPPCRIPDQRVLPGEVGAHGAPCSTTS